MPFLIKSLPKSKKEFKKLGIDAEDGEMSLRVGERFIVEKSELENPDGWCFATRYDQTGDGYVPAAYLRLSQPGSGRPKWMPTAV